MTARTHRLLVALGCVALLCTLFVGWSASAEEQAAPAPAEAAASAPEGSTAPPAEDASKENGGKWLSGRFEAGADASWSADDSDLDLDQTLRLDVTPPNNDRIRLRSLLWLQEDLDGDESKSSALRDVNDAYDSDLRARLIDLHLEIDDLWGDSDLWIGRQRINESAAFNRIDGLYFKKRLGTWDWYVFAGARAELYLDSHHDFVGGGGASWTPLQGTRLALDTYYGEQGRSEEITLWWNSKLLDLRYPRRVKDNIDDRIAALSVWQDVTENLRLFGRYAWRDGNGDQLTLTASGLCPKLDVSFDLTYRSQLNGMGDNVDDFHGYYRVLGEYSAYDHWRLALHKPLGEKFMISLEAETHEAEGGDWITGNRDYDRLALILAADKLPQGFSGNIGLEWWDVDNGEGRWAVTGEVSKAWDKVTLTLGADYEAYDERYVRYNPWLRPLDQLAVLLIPGYFQTNNPLVIAFDQYAVEEHEDIYSIYTKLRWAFRENQDLDFGVTYEMDDSPDSPYWRVKAGYAVRF